MPKTLLLKDISDDVLEIIYDEQNEQKKIKKRVVPMEKAVESLIKKSRSLELELYKSKKG